VFRRLGLSSRRKWETRARKSGGIRAGSGFKGVPYVEGLSLKSDGAKRHLLVPIWDGRNNPLYSRTPMEEHRAKELVPRPTLSAGINLLYIFLVFKKYDCIVLDVVQEVWVCAVPKDASGSFPEYEAAHPHSLGPS
jgi:hypothetical protein